MSLEMKPNQRVIVKNIKYLWSEEFDHDTIEYWKHLVGQCIFYTGKTAHKYFQDEDYDNYDEDDEDSDDNRTREIAYQFKVLDTDGDVTTLWLFKHNFELISSEPPKDDIEWMDRVQMNFKY